MLTSLKPDCPVTAAGFCFVFQAFAELRRWWGHAGPSSPDGGTISLKGLASHSSMVAVKGMTTITRARRNVLRNVLALQVRPW